MDDAFAGIASPVFDVEKAGTALECLSLLNTVVMEVDSGASSHYVTDDVDLDHMRAISRTVLTARKGDALKVGAEGEELPGSAAGDGGPQVDVSTEAQQSADFQFNAFSVRKAVQEGQTVCFAPEGSYAYILVSGGSKLPLRATGVGWELHLHRGSECLASCSGAGVGEYPWRGCGVAGDIDEEEEMHRERYSSRRCVSRGCVYSSRGCVHIPRRCSIPGRQQEEAGTAGTAGATDPATAGTGGAGGTGVKEAASTAEQGGAVVGSTRGVCSSVQDQRAKRKRRQAAGERHMVHRQWAHANGRGLRRTAECGHVLGLLFDGELDHTGCATCMRKNARKSPFKKRSFNRTRRRGYRIHSDLKEWPCRSKHGFKYSICFVDDATRRGAAYAMRTKDQALEMLRRFIDECFGRTMVGSTSAKRFRCSVGREAPIKREYSPPMCQSAGSVRASFAKHCTGAILPAKRTSGGKPVQGHGPVAVN
jgi:hypothetical protein